MGCTSSGKESVVMKNRKATLKKKASELSTLCGAEVCMVFLDAANGNLEVWPEDVHRANATLINYNHIIQSQPPPKKPKTTTTSNKPPAAADLNLNLNLKEKKKQIILDQSRGAAGEASYDSFDMNNPHHMVTNNCNMVMVDQFHQLVQPPLPFATMEFSLDRDRTTMAASDLDTLSNFNNIIDDATLADYFTDVDVGNTISIDDDDGSDDQYWNNLLGAVEIDSDLASDLYFLMEDNKEISNPILYN